MRKRVFPRILWFLFLACAVFVFLVMVQFTRRGNFSQRIGDMLISGRYSPEADDPPNQRTLDGGASVVFGGLEFRLNSVSETDSVFSLVDLEGSRQQVFPEYVVILENEAAFTLPGGAELSFVSHNPGQSAVPELWISGKFPDDISAVHIPFRAYRSQVIRNNGNDALSISYNGSRYQFSRTPQGIDSGWLILSAAAPAISYRVVTDSEEFNPADFIIPQAKNAQAFTDTLSYWVTHNFELWGKMNPQVDEDTVIAWCGEAVQRGMYPSAASVIPLAFSPNPQRTWESAVYQFDRKIGVWEREVMVIHSLEREKINRISRLLTEKENSLFAENHLIDFLAIRGHGNLVDNFLSFVQEAAPLAITVETGSGILENFLDTEKWRPYAVNPFEPLAEQVCRFVADNLHRADDQIFVFSDGHAGAESNLRLGMALSKWGEKHGRNDWAALGQSLILSVISLGSDDGSVPASLEMNSSGEFIPSGGRVSSAKLYRLLGNNEYLPHVTATGANGIWAWTAASSLSIAQNERQMDISIRFPVGQTHYIMLRNVKPFPLLQIYDMNWRRAADFESYYDSSGWYYFEQEQILVIKIMHRSNVENVKILFTAPRVETPPPPPPPPPPPEAEQTAGNSGQNTITP